MDLDKRSKDCLIANYSKQIKLSAPKLFNYHGVEWSGVVPQQALHNNSIPSLSQITLTSRGSERGKYPTNFPTRRPSRGQQSPEIFFFLQNIF